MDKEQKFYTEEENHLKLGYDCINRQEWNKAIEEFKKVIEKNSLNIWAHIELGKLYRNKTEFHLAEKKFKEVLAMPLNSEQAEQVHIGLGDAYRMQGKYDLAVEEFKNAIKINPDNERLSLWIKGANEVEGFRKQIPPYRIFFTWRIHYQCNYRCSYCLAPKPENPFFNQEQRNQAVYLTVKEWMKIWDNIYKKYGSCRIRLDGGEPSTYPSFIELVSVISEMHFLQINTNLSFDVENFVKKANPERVRIDASFHPEFVSLEDFVDKISLLNEYKFKIVVSCVAYLSFLDKIKEYKQPFANLGIPFIIHPLSGEFYSKSYPRDYEMEEISKIYDLDEASRLVMNWRKGENRTTKGKLCRMGQMYATIYPNGEVYRCCAHENSLKLGNINEEAFQLLDNPSSCASENCPCWKCMIVTEEKRWTSLWIDDWEIIP